MIHKFQKLGFILFAAAFFGLYIFSANAQSGRIKSTENPTPTPRRVSVPIVATVVPSPTPTPTPKPSPTPKPVKIDDDEPILVNSILIPIPVSITDVSGKPIADLQLKDFELLIDGKKEEITEVSRSETPVSLVLLFDNSSSLSSARDFELKATTRFFKRVLRPNKDQAALFSFSTGARLEQALTKDVKLLTQAVDNFPLPNGATSLLDTIVRASKYLQEADGRRIIVLVSDGADTYSEATLDDAVKAAQVANCQIYVVKTTDFENYRKTGIRKSNANLWDLAAERRMQELTLQTGGAVYSPIDENELSDAFTQISAELASQYVLSYYPDNEKYTGQFRQIELRLPTRKDLTLRTRKGYYIPRTK